LLQLLTVFMRKFFTLLALTLLYICTARAQSKNPSYSQSIEEKIARVEAGLGGWVKIEDSLSTRTLKQQMALYKVHGVSIAVIRDFKLEWARGYGYADTSDKRPVTTATLFQAASISKSLNAMGVLKLVDQKKIDLQQNINTWLKSWKFPEDSFTRTQKINVAHLLSHTAGLSVHGFPGYHWKDSLPGDNEILDGQRPANTKAVRSLFEPGKKFQYSGGGTTITKKIIADVTNDAYDNYMHRQVLEPMGMVGSFFSQPPPPGAFPYLATAYYADGKPVSGKFHIYPEQAADGLWTHPSDLAKFIIELQLSLQGKSNKVLSKEMAVAMVTPYIDQSAALGVFISEKGKKKYFQHGGANEGFRCQYFGSLENGDGVVVMVNSDNGAIIQEIINSVATVYGWKDFYTPTIKKTVRVPADTLKAYVGDYQLVTNKLSITQHGNHLFLVDHNSKDSSRMYFTDNRSFFIYEVPAELQLTRNNSGQVNGLLLKQNGREFTFTRSGMQ
jgi:Beta-lactamase class C and other penicillin binding proteins